MTSKLPGIVLFCTRGGMIERVAHDDLGITKSQKVGQSFASLFDSGSAKKAAEFFALLVEQGVAFDWELNLNVDACVIALRFVGAVAGVGYVIAGAASCFDAAAYCAANVPRDGEHSDALQEVFTRVALSGHRVEAEQLEKRYDEFSRINNQLVNMQRELARKNAELARLNDEKNRLLGIVAHDLRNPLGVILSYNQVLALELSHLLNEEQREIIRVIGSSIEFMRRLINELLDFAKFEMGALELHREEVDLVALVRQSVVRNRILASRKHIELRFESDTNLPAVSVDRMKIEQVLDNLISNAIKFSHPHTAVDVHIISGDETAIISVKDQGQGIPHGDLGKLFEPFQRTRVTSTGGESSTGLGLTIVQRIVTGHGGSISVDSEVGKGTVFHVSLPAPGHRAYP